MHDVITKRISLQSSATATGNGTAMNVTGYDNVLVHLEGISGDTITFETTENESDWYGVKATNLTSGDSSTTATADGLYVANILGATKFRARISTYGSGTITANARATKGNASASSGGGGIQYTEGATDSSITGTALMWEDTSDTLRAVSASKPLPISPGSYATDESAMPATPVILPVGGEYRASATTYADGDAVVNQYDANGNLKITAGTKIAGEDLENDTLGVTQKTVVGSTYSGTAFTNYGAANNANVKAAAGMIKSIRAQNENAAIRYLQIFNLAAAPTDDSSVPIFSFEIAAGSGTVPGVTEVGSNFFGEGGYYLSTGLSWGISVDPDVFDNTGVTAGEHQVNGVYL